MVGEFEVLVSPRAKKQLKKVASQYRCQYEKAFRLLAVHGPEYPSLRSHRYRQGRGEVWGSSASMFLRFYWDFAGTRKILVAALGHH